MATVNAPAARLPLAAPEAIVVSRERISTAAWISITVVALFLAITTWWLTQNSTIPVFDAGLHLSLTIDVYEKLRGGNLGSALTLSVPYPPLSYLIGTLGMWIGGIGVNQAILAENLVFVPLLSQ